MNRTIMELRPKLKHFIFYNVDEYESYHHGIETGETLRNHTNLFRYESYHHGIETKFDTTTLLIIGDMNRTIMELRLLK